MQLKPLVIGFSLIATAALASPNQIDPRLVIDALQASLRLREAQLELLTEERDYWRAYAGFKSEAH